MSTWEPDPDVELNVICNCGTPTQLTRSQDPYYQGAAPDWICYCPNCMDGAPDAGPLSNIQGHGKTPGAAQWDWQESHDMAHDVTWEPVTTLSEAADQAAAEFTRQQGFRRVASEAFPGSILVLIGQAPGQDFQ